MKKIISLIAICIFISSTLWAKDSSDKIILLEEVSSFLKVYQDSEQFNFIGDSIIYKEIEIENYDNIFRESALIYATILQVNGTVNGINERSIPLQDPFAIRSVGFAVKDLPKMGDRISSLRNEIENLDPRSDFRGRQMRTAPLATRGINLSRQQLQKSAEILPELLKSLEEIAAEILD